MVREMLGVSLVGSLLDAILALGYVGVLLWLDASLAVVAVVIFAGQLAVVLRLAARIRRQHREELLASADADSLIVDAIAGIASIRTSAAEGTVLGKWSGFVNRRLDVATRRSRATAVMAAVTTTGELAAPIVFLFVAASSATSPSAAIGLAALAGAVLAPLTNLSLRFVTLAELGPLLEPMLDVMTAPREASATSRPTGVPSMVAPVPPWPVEPDGASSAAPPFRGEVELVNAGFRYDIRSPFVFRGLDVRIQPGMKVAVVGASGCGKSTLISALTGLHPLTEGRLLLDGMDISMLDLPSVRRQIGVVLQDPYLGLGTIPEAITLGRGQASDDQVFRAAGMAAVHDDIVSMPLGYSTPIAEGGRGVSRRSAATDRAGPGTHRQPVGADPRRGHERPGRVGRECDRGGPSRPANDQNRDCPSPFDGRRCRSGPGHARRPVRRGRTARVVAPAWWPLRRDGGPAGQSVGGARPGGVAPSDAHRVAGRPIPRPAPHRRPGASDAGRSHRQGADRSATSARREPFRRRRCW
jgi:ABC-type multidrug transport system fused ATPase/permease subunit